jgi:acetolactate synthase-1/3 small subunit
MNQLLRGALMRSATARVSRSSVASSASKQQVRAFASSPKLERQHSFLNVSPKSRTGAKTAEDAVNNILYNVPTGRNTETKHTLSVLVDNATGVLSKVSGLLSARGFNIDSLTVSATDVHDLSRMTIVLNGADNQLEQAKRQLEDLVDVWAVLDYKG